MNRPRFEFKPALKLAAIALILALGAGVLLLLLAPPTADMRLLGQGVGQFAGLSFVGGVLASFQEQTGNPKMALLMKKGDGKDKIRGYVDSDFAGCRRTARSTRLWRPPPHLRKSEKSFRR